MSDLVAPDELADRLGVSRKILEARTRDNEWIRREYPVGEWAVYDEEGELLGYQIPLLVRRRLGLEVRANAGETAWWSWIFG